jgi:hypothetical protein
VFSLNNEWIYRFDWQFFIYFSIWNFQRTKSSISVNSRRSIQRNVETLTCVNVYAVSAYKRSQLNFITLRILFNYLNLFLASEASHFIKMSLSETKKACWGRQCIKESKLCGLLDDGIINHFLVRNVSIMEKLEKVACL